MTKANQVAVTEKEETAVQTRPDWMNANSNRGSEEVTSQDITLPRLQIIQDLSPQHKKSKEEYIDGAEVGDFFNSVTQELFKQSAIIVPVYFKAEYIIWKDQKAGGGFFGSYDSEVEAKRELPRIIKEGGGNPEDYEVVDTNVHYVLLVSESGEAEQAVISMSKSQNKVSRNLNTMVRLAGGDRFSRQYRLSTVTDKNKAGQEFMNWSVKPIGWVTEEIYKIAEATYEAIKAGERKVDHGPRPETQSDVAAPAKDGDLEDEFAV